MTLILSAFFAGISGGLSAINFEIVSAENVSALRSGGILLFTFIGGIGFFFGPIIGAVIGVFLTVMLSDFTKAWQLYLGVFFILIVMYAPGGIASLLMMNVRLYKFGKFGRVGPKLLAISAASLVIFSGVVMMIEMLYHLTLNAANGPVMKLFGTRVNTEGMTAWSIAVVLIVVGIIAFRAVQSGFQQAWGDANSEIEDSIRKEQA